MEIRSNAYDGAHRPLPRADITRPNRETIDRVSPKPADAEDVRAQLARDKQQKAERIAAARSKKMDARAQRAQAERQERTERALAAREKRNERIKLARLKHTAKEGAPTSEASPADTVELSRTPASQAERAKAVREDMLADRAQNARESLSLRAERAEHARGKRAERIEHARDKVSLSETTLRLSVDDTSDGPDKAQQIAKLRELYRKGVLNTDELIARAAFKLLSGE